MRHRPEANFNNSGSAAMSVINGKHVSINSDQRRNAATPNSSDMFWSYRFRSRAFTTRFRLLPTFLTAFFTADADLRVFFAV